MQGAAAGGLAAVGEGAERQPQASLVFGKSATLGSLSALPAEHRTPEHRTPDHRTPDHRTRPATAAAMLATPYDTWPGPTPGVGGSEDVRRATTSHEPRRAAPITRPSTVATRFGPRPHTSMSSTARRPATVDAATGRLTAAPLSVQASGEAAVCSASTSRLLSSWQERARGQLEAQAQVLSAARSAGPQGPLRAACTHNGGWAKGGAVRSAVAAAALLGAWSAGAAKKAAVAEAEAVAVAKAKAAEAASPPQRLAPRWAKVEATAEDEAIAGAEAKSPLAPSSRPMSSGFALEARLVDPNLDPGPDHCLTKLDLMTIEETEHQHQPEPEPQPQHQP